MNENNQWLLQQLDDLIKNEPQYEQRALLEGLKKIINEQDLRLEQLQNEIDGRLWNHDQW
ncbi:hypothetical protein MOO45_05300 [Bombilactobacillus folatiphilus]|uniref:Phage protein n=1 Tax=Bombilactobacillus folatiphilus TaxID=2923362 RepID=A0ABY4P7F8_9LACO|nr:hypothetical protein [Bombilactobacillus folatiphilus]UQS81635.1 hypothetical protein MOO45_05300 [Bombilactobacillus folatiphilus]